MHVVIEMRIIFSDISTNILLAESRTLYLVLCTWYIVQFLIRTLYFVQIDTKKVSSNLRSAQKSEVPCVGIIFLPIIHIKK